MVTTVERRNFRCHKQQEGETFDDFLIALQELTKMCKFCLDECTKKSFRDQIIKGLQDPETIEDLLKEKDLTMETTIMHCRSCETARRYHADLGHEDPSTMAEIQTPHQTAKVKPPFSGCGGPWHKGG